MKSSKKKQIKNTTVLEAPKMVYIVASFVDENITFFLLGRY